VRVGLPLYPTAKLQTDSEVVVTLFSARYSKISEKYPAHYMIKRRTTWVPFFFLHLIGL